MMMMVVVPRGIEIRRILRVRHIMHLRVMRELQALNSRSALVGDGADDIGDRIGLIPQMAVRHVREAGLAKALEVPLGSGRRVEEARFHVWVDVVGDATLGAAGGAEGASGAIATLGGFGCGGCVREGRSCAIGDARTAAGGLRAGNGFFVGGRGVRDATAREVALHFGGFGEGAHDVLHVVRLAADEGAQVDDDALGFVALAEDGFVGVLQSRQLLFVAFTLALELFGDFLLQDEGFEGVVALLFRALEAGADARGVVLVLLDKGDEAAVFALVLLDFGFEVLGFFGEGFGEGLEFEELGRVSRRRR